MPVNAGCEALPAGGGESFGEVAAEFEARLAPSVGHRAHEMGVSLADMPEEEVEDVIVEGDVVVCPVAEQDVAKDEDKGMAGMRGDEPVGDIARGCFAWAGVLEEEEGRSENLLPRRREASPCRGVGHGAIDCAVYPYAAMGGEKLQAEHVAEKGGRNLTCGVAFSDMGG